jgi:hypothetical protein
VNRACWEPPCYDMIDTRCYCIDLASQNAWHQLLGSDPQRIAWYGCCPAGVAVMVMPSKRGAPLERDSTGAITSPVCTCTFTTEGTNPAYNPNVPQWHFTREQVGSIVCAPWWAFGLTGGSGVTTLVITEVIETIRLPDAPCKPAKRRVLADLIADSIARLQHRVRG